jgi:hypothetical protein
MEFLKGTEQRENFNFTLFQLYLRTKETWQPFFCCFFIRFHSNFFRKSSFCQQVEWDIFIVFSVMISKPQKFVTSRICSDLYHFRNLWSSTGSSKLQDNFTHVEFDTIVKTLIWVIKLFWVELISCSWSLCCR